MPVRSTEPLDVATLMELDDETLDERWYDLVDEDDLTAAEQTEFAAIEEERNDRHGGPDIMDVPGAVDY